MHQAPHQKHPAVQRYAEFQRTARSMHRQLAATPTHQVRSAPSFTCAGDPPPARETFDSIPILAVMAIAAGVVFGMRLAGWL